MSPADPGKQMPAANGGASRHPGRAGSWERRARPENKASHLFPPSFHRQPLSASPRWIVPAFSLLQLFTGSPWCRHAHKERVAAEPVPVPPALRAPPRPREHSGVIDPAGRACPGPAWAGSRQSPPRHPLLHRLWLWGCEEGAPKGLGSPFLPVFGHSRFGGGNSADGRQSKYTDGRVYFTRAWLGSAYLS